MFAPFVKSYLTQEHRKEIVMNTNQDHLPVVNWHFTGLCNYRCPYCLASHKKSALTLEKQRIILEKLRGHFSRINFAGGEPTLSHDFRVLVEEVHSLGFVCSIITNGYLLARQPEQFSWLYERVHTIGVSIDSLDATCNRKLGRCTETSDVLQREEYKALCSTIKAKGVRLKINTVVSKLNLDEHFLSFYKEVSPDRLKLLQVFYPPQTSFLREEKDVSITEEEFNHFVKENTDETLRDILVVEDNEAMTNAYYLLESDGCFRDNGTGESSPSLLNEDVDVPKALEGICIDKKKYNDRYQGEEAQME